MRMTCTCGCKISNQQAPNEIELIVYTDREWSEICDCDSIQPWMIPRPHYNVWKCPDCQRLYFYEGDADMPCMVYQVENKETKLP